MRLDHLLSTENTVHVFGQCEPHGRRQSASLLWMLVWKRSMAWMGFVPSGSGMGMLLGSRTATPRVFCGAVRCPCVAAGPGWLVGSCGAWWFENWIVDASKGNFGFFLLIAISPNSSIEFGFEIDRFVIILVLRFVVWRSCYQETRGWGNDNLFCCCAACEGVWWMPWQTVPMKDV